MANMTPEQMIMKIKEFQIGCHEAIINAMEKAALNIEATAKKYCTPGASPYDWFIYRSKEHYAQIHGREYHGAPYSLNDAVLHMRDTIQGNVRNEGDMVVGVVWTPVDYAIYVHEGTSMMQPPRPFLLDACQDELPDTMRLIEKGIKEAIKERAE